MVCININLALQLLASCLSSKIFRQKKEAKNITVTGGWHLKSSIKAPKSMQQIFTLRTEMLGNGSKNEIGLDINRPFQTAPCVLLCPLNICFLTFFRRTPDRNGLGPQQENNGTGMWTSMLPGYGALSLSNTRTWSVWVQQGACSSFTFLRKCSGTLRLKRCGR